MLSKFYQNYLHNRVTLEPYHQWVADLGLLPGLSDFKTLVLPLLALDNNMSCLNLVFLKDPDDQGIKPISADPAIA